MTPDATLDDRRLRGQWAARLIAAALCVAAALAAAPAASAHARLTATRPEQGAVVPHAPARATFTFDEAVRSGGEAKLDGERLAGELRLPTRLEAANRVLVARLPARLADGVYTVTWRVVSDDRHVETGALAFGGGGGTPAPGARVSQQTGAGRAPAAA